MRLTKLEVHGFKAFADHLEFVFEKGVTAIVGPNGSGKSNVSDAVRWVLGEQRARAMRGAKMEDVIFHGSSARKAVNMAEVSLHFDNTSGELPVPFKEVVITRRLLRSSESEYLLNRAPCRLRDIQDLVRGTGLGADSGVVIESKMIDALLSDRPDERRELFEEAAGVGLCRDRRRSAEQRRDTARGIAASLNFAAIGIIYTHERRRAVGRLDNDQLIATDAGMPVGQSAHLRAGQRQRGFARVEHNKIVAQPVHLEKVPHHGCASRSGGGNCPTVALATRRSSVPARRSSKPPLTRLRARQRLPTVAPIKIQGVPSCSTVATF